MCGIAGIITRNTDSFNTVEKIATMSQAISHRGPDGEGFLIVSNNQVKPYYNLSAPASSLQALAYLQSAKLPDYIPSVSVALAHRRLSIIDLAATGHQPMCDTHQNLWITYNGEIYNYLELKNELIALGHHFVSQSDTEVVIAAYSRWGSECVKKFNGMWSFFIYDHQKQIGFASRDRFGVKPFYYVNIASHFSFASEQKAFIKSGLIKARASDDATAAYLVHGALERESQNFFEGIEELMPGNNLFYNFKDHSYSIEQYYRLSESVNLINDALPEKNLIEKISHDFKESVRLRLRSDVEVGTCLSGGIDSSAITVTMASLGVKNIHCFTSVFSGEVNNEDHYASLVAGKINAFHHKVEPDHESFMRDADELIYSQDVPIWSTSTYAQHKVMQLAGKHGIKVVLDGQGADELFAGYHHHLIAKWNHQFRSLNVSQLIKELKATKKTISAPIAFFIKEKLKGSYDFVGKRSSFFLEPDFQKKSKNSDAVHYFTSVNDQLEDDIIHSRLKIFLKCEDRCGMWHGVESRTPFSDDINLINTAFSFSGEKKIKNGVLKYLLREAVKEQLPKSIYERYDKTGFETPMNAWLQALKHRMLEEIEHCQFPFLKKNALSQIDFSNTQHLQFFFKLFVLVRWKKVFEA